MLLLLHIQADMHAADARVCLVLVLARPLRRDIHLIAMRRKLAGKGCHHALSAAAL